MAPINSSELVEFLIDFDSDWFVKNISHGAGITNTLGDFTIEAFGTFLLFSFKKEIRRGGVDTPTIVNLISCLIFSFSYDHIVEQHEID